MFEKIVAAPPDPILGLSDAFKRDPNPNKINLGVGVYKDAGGNTPILASVKEAERRLIESEKSKTYLPIEGTEAFTAATQALILGPDHEIIHAKRAATAETPGGTGALRIAADTLARLMPDVTVWISDPTWPNHASIFSYAGLKVATYPYFDAANNRVAFDDMLAQIKQIPAGDILLLHGCCQNPTGLDLSLEQWQIVGDVIAERGILPLLDFAYQGFAAGLDEDAAGVRSLCRPGAELIIASSYSKNFGLYNERVGALTFVGADQAAAQAMLSHAKTASRASFSTPPFHGAGIVSTVLNDPALRAQWEQELTHMRDRINSMRHLMVETLNEKGVERDFSFIARQRGMFTLTGLNPEHVKLLRDEYAIYIVGSGRINVAGVSESSIDYLCSAIADVLKRVPAPA